MIPRYFTDQDDPPKHQLLEQEQQEMCLSEALITQQYTGLSGEFVLEEFSQDGCVESS